MKEQLNDQDKILIIKEVEGITTDFKKEALRSIDPELKKEFVATLQATDNALKTWNPILELDTKTIVQGAALKRPTILITLHEFWIKAVAACLLVIFLALLSIIISGGQLNKNSLIGLGEEDLDNSQLIELAFEE